MLPGPVAAHEATLLEDAELTQLPAYAGICGQWDGQMGPLLEGKMTTQVYEWTGPTGVQFKQIKSAEGTYYFHDTPPTVAKILDNAMRTGQRLRLFEGDTKTGEAWAEEYDVLGRIGRSCGRIKIPLLIHNSRSMGGPAISDHTIVAIADRPGHFIYKHPRFNVGTWTVGKAESPSYVEAAYHNGTLHAQFKRKGAASRYCAFMRGERFSKS